MLRTAWVAWSVKCQTPALDPGDDFWVVESSLESGSTWGVGSGWDYFSFSPSTPPLAVSSLKKKLNKQINK